MGMSEESAMRVRDVIDVRDHLRYLDAGHLLAHAAPSAMARGAPASRCGKRRGYARRRR